MLAATGQVRESKQESELVYEQRLTEWWPVATAAVGTADGA
jgi:hypothetical protein